MTNKHPDTPNWWRRDSLQYRGDRLIFCNRDVAEFARPFAEPVFLYDANRLTQNVLRLTEALASRGVAHRVYFAMKANRFRPLLCHLRTSGLHGLDVCSAEEMREALACGYRPDQISYTSHGLTGQDAAFLSAFPDVIVNCDTISAMRSLGQLCPGRRMGVRINPATGIGYGDDARLTYAGERATKFGVYREQFGQALETARQYGLKVVGLHCHAGCGYLTPQLDAFERVLLVVKDFMAQLPDLETVNLGGGLGAPHRPGDRPLDLDRWAGLIARHVARPGVETAVEPGDYIVKDAGMLVLRVTYVETKRDRLFIGLNGGFNLAMEPVFYGLPCAPVPCVIRPGVPVTATIAGNINEALDIWAEDLETSPVAEGDYFALLNAGGYGSSMSSNHCLSGAFREFIFH